MAKKAKKVAEPIVVDIVDYDEYRFNLEKDQNTIIFNSEFLRAYKVFAASDKDTTATVGGAVIVLPAGEEVVLYKFRAPTANHKITVEVEPNMPIAIRVN